MGAHGRGQLKSIDFAVCTLKSIKIAQINKNERNQHIWCVQMKRAQFYIQPPLLSELHKCGFEYDLYLCFRQLLMNIIKF